MSAEIHPGRIPSDVPAEARSAREVGMLFRPVSLLLGGLFLTACADMLGLGGLTYDQGDGQGSGGAGVDLGGVLISAGDGDEGSPGGASFVSESEDFSILLERGAVLAASPLLAEKPTYFFFEPEAENLSARQQSDDTSELLGAWDWPAPNGISHLAVVPIAGGLTLISYDQISGLTSQARKNEEGTFEILSSDIGTSGRTHVLPLFTGEEWLAFVYSASDGNYRYFRPLPSTNPELFAGTSESGWTSIDRFTDGTEVGLLKHNSTTQVLQFDRFHSPGQPLEARFEVSLSQQFSHMVTFDDSKILLYQEGPGKVVTGTIVQDASGARWEETENGYFRGNLSQIVPLSGILQAQALTFSADSGQAVLRELDPLSGTDVVVVR